MRIKSFFLGLNLLIIVFGFVLCCYSLPKLVCDMRSFQPSPQITAWQLARIYISTNGMKTKEVCFGTHQFDSIDNDLKPFFRESK